MRRYADPVEVRQGPLDDARDLDGQRLGAQGATEGPQQFLWRGRLWKVRAVLAHWVETGPWWQSTGVRAVIGSEDAAPGAAPEAESRGRVPIGDLLTERELWRVEAGRGPSRPAGGATAGPEGIDGAVDGAVDGGGVFDLAFDWSDGRWALVGCAD